AYQFDSSVQRWDDATKLDEQITVAVLSTRAFEQLTGDSGGRVAGVTTGPNVFAVPARAVQDHSADTENTIAHELGHIQDLREAGRNIQHVPIYLQEGKEYLL